MRACKTTCIAPNRKKTIWVGNFFYKFKMEQSHQIFGPSSCNFLHGLWCLSNLTHIITQFFHHLFTLTPLNKLKHFWRTLCKIIVVNSSTHRCQPLFTFNLICFYWQKSNFEGLNLTKKLVLVWLPEKHEKIALIFITIHGSEPDLLN